MNRHGAKLRIRDSKGGIEGPVFHVVAHVGDERRVVTRNLAEVVVAPQNGNQNMPRLSSTSSNRKSRK